MKYGPVCVSHENICVSLCPAFFDLRTRRKVVVGRWSHLFLDEVDNTERKTGLYKYARIHLSTKFSVLWFYYSNVDLWGWRDEKHHFALKFTIILIFGALMLTNAELHWDIWSKFFKSMYSWRMYLFIVLATKCDC